MAIITLNPVISSIHGKMGSIVFVKRNGTQFIRRYVVPHDPKTQLQLTYRRNFADLIALWQKLPQSIKDSWNRYGESGERNGYNLFISENMKALRLGKSPELVKIKYLKENEYSYFSVLKKYYKYIQLSSSIPCIDPVYLNCKHSFPDRNFSCMQRE